MSLFFASAAKSYMSRQKRDEGRFAPGEACVLINDVSSLD